MAHEGHHGITKTKPLLGEKVWFTGIDRMTEDAIKRCIPCQAATPETKYEPLKMTQLPKEPWTELSTDFDGPIPSGDYLLVVIDDYSRYPVVEVVRSTSANTVIPVFDKIFSTFRIPCLLKSDNRPPFNSAQLNSYEQHMGIKHRHITPYWPRANGEAERFMRNLGKVITTASSENKPWKQELNKFLCNYRATPHVTTKVSPFKVLFGRDMQTKLPHLSGSNITDAALRDTDCKAKANMKTYADQRLHDKPSTLKEGDTVLVKQAKRNKKTPQFDPNPYHIIQKKGSMIIASRTGHTITRNASHFKGIPPTNTVWVVIA